MDTDKIATLIRKHYTAYQQAQMAAQMALQRLQAVAEAADLSAEQVNEAIGANLFSDAQPEEPTKEA